jgi:hypothetical protein
MIQKSYTICNKDSYESIIEVSETLEYTTAILMLTISSCTALLDLDEAKELRDIIDKIIMEKANGSNNKEKR